MERIRIILYTLVALAFVGCGGGGGTVGGGGGTTITVQPANAQIGKGASIAFTGFISIGGSVSWTATQGTIVKKGPNSATYTAPNQGGVYQVTATDDADASITKTVTVGVTDPNAAIVAGFVYETNTTSGPILPVIVTFYDAGGNLVGQVASLNDGSFTAEPPVTAVTFSLDPTSLLNSGNNNAYLYNSLGYTTLSASCHSPLPPLIKGTSVSLPGGPIFVYPNAVVPPPPTGCGL